jgi:hypothetical protein
MTTTSPDAIRTPDNGDAYNLVADLATMASDVQDALIERANAYKGTATARAAFTSAPNGTLWQDTNSGKSLYRMDDGTWVDIIPTVAKEYGTVSERNAITPTFGQMWTDTDSNYYTWKGGKGGTVDTWRRRSGRINVASAAWQTTGNGNAGRTITISVPTTIESGESILVSIHNGGSGFNWITTYSVGSSSGGSTPITIRLMQLMNDTAQQAVTVAWELVDLPAAS